MHASSRCRGSLCTAVLELGAAAELRLYGTCAARDRDAVERLGAVAIDYQTEDFLERVPAYHLTVDRLAWNSSSNFRSPAALPFAVK